MVTRGEIFSLRQQNLSLQQKLAELDEHNRVLIINLQQREADLQLMAQLGPKSVNNTPRLSVGSGVFGLKGSKGGTPSRIPYSQYGSSIGELCIFLQATCSCGYIHVHVS